MQASTLPAGARSCCLRPRRHTLLASAVAAVAIGSLSPRCALAQQRALGLDISAWQGNISQTTWNNIRNVENRQFVFLRSSRGGTTGYYNQSNASNTNPPGQNTLSQRYDDPYYIQNMSRATTAGLYAGTYHFSRPDIIASTLNSNGIPNNGTDEANHFMQMAGPFMRPGYLLPVHDFEAGDGARTDNEMAQFCLDFSNRIHEVMGIRPAIYINGNYAQNILGGASQALRDEIVATHPTLWSARWPNQANPDSILVQTAHPKDSFANIYGAWDDYGTVHPWSFWQYASTGRLQSFNNGGSNLDMNVAQGGVEFLKDNLVPALWVNNNSGEWATLANWNSGQTPVAPVQGPGQVARVGGMILPAPRLPGAEGSGVTAGSNDTVILDRPNADITVTHSTGTTNIRKLYLRETLDITGGSLTINYVPSADSTPISAQFSGNATLSGAATSFSVHTLLVDASTHFNLNGGTATLDTINLTRGTTPAKINIGGNITLAPLANAAAVISSTGSGTNPSLDLTGGARTITVNDGNASVDLAVNVPLVNGTLTKSGPGTMQLGVANTLSGLVTVDRGILLVTGANQLGTTGVVTNQTVVTPGSGGSGYGGSLQLSNNVSYNLPMIIAGSGNTGVSLTTPGSVGALDNLSGTNTWAGNITFNGTGTSGSDPLENQIGARAGTLVLSGVLANGAGVNATWAKTGAGDVVLTGGAANTYSNLTRLFGGRLILEKDGALGAAGSPSVAAGNFYQNANSDSTLAFRAPASSPGGFSYSTWEILNTEGAGAAGFGQIDNLSGNNTFAGAIALGGPTLGGAITSSIGVTAGSLTVQGGLYARGSSGVRTINKTGAGTLVVTNSVAPPTPIDNPLVVPLTGSTFNINAGRVDLQGPSNSVESAGGIATWNVNNGTLRNAAGLLNGGTVNVPAGGTFEYAGGIVNLAALNLTGGNASVTAGGAKKLRTAALLVGGASKLQLNDNDLIVDYTGAATPAGSWNGNTYTGIAGLVQSGRGNGSWNGPSGILTAGADAVSGLTTLGVVEASDALGISGTQTAAWNGQTVDGETVLVMYTYAGDANLDGKINVDDYGQIDLNVDSSGSAFGYFAGDFNYDGKIDVDDYGIIDFNVNAQGAPLAGGASLGGVAAVPEPACLGVLAGAALATSMRRRQRRPA